MEVVGNSSHYRFVSWNVERYTPVIHVWLKQYLEAEQPDVVFLTETKKSVEELQRWFGQFDDYHHVINAHVPVGHHGVAMLIKKEHTYTQFAVPMGIGVRSDSKSSEASTGRVILIQLNGEMNVIGTYTPNSGSGLKNLEYRTEVWDPAFYRLLETARTSGPTLWMGDVNVALSNLDVSDPVGMSSWAGFTLPERQNFNTLLSSGNWIDPWREQHPGIREYSWVGKIRRPNFGMRIDNVIVSDTLWPRVVDSAIVDDGPNSSDHLPIGVTLSR